MIMILRNIFLRMSIKNIFMIMNTIQYIYYNEYKKYIYDYYYDYDYDYDYDSKKYICQRPQPFGSK